MCAARSAGQSGETPCTATARASCARSEAGRPEDAAEGDQAESAAGDRAIERGPFCARLRTRHALFIFAAACLTHLVSLDRPILTSLQPVDMLQPHTLCSVRPGDGNDRPPRGAGLFFCFFCCPSPTLKLVPLPHPTLPGKQSSDQQCSPTHRTKLGQPNAKRVRTIVSTFRLQFVRVLDFD